MKRYQVKLAFNASYIVVAEFDGKDEFFAVYWAKKNVRPGQAWMIQEVVTVAYGEGE